MNNISISELKQLIPRINIIDIRDNYQYNLGKIITAKNVPMNFLLMNPDNYINKNEKFYIYCQYGSKSERTCMILRNKGYDVINILGGYNQYVLSNNERKN